MSLKRTPDLGARLAAGLGPWEGAWKTVMLRSTTPPLGIEAARLPALGIALGAGRDGVLNPTSRSSSPAIP